MDDILIQGENEEIHSQHLAETLEVFEAAVEQMQIPTEAGAGLKTCH